MEQIEVNKESKIGDPNNTSIFRVLTKDQKICFPIPPQRIISREINIIKGNGSSIPYRSPFDNTPTLYNILRDHGIELAWLIIFAQFLAGMMGFFWGW